MELGAKTQRGAFRIRRNKQETDFKNTPQPARRWDFSPPLQRVRDRGLHPGSMFGMLMWLRVVISLNSTAIRTAA